MPSRAGRSTPPLAVLLLLALGVHGTVRPDSQVEDAIHRLIDAGRYDEAETKSRALLDDARKRGGPGELDEARAIDLLSEVFRWQERSHEPEALTLARRAVAIKEKLLSPDSPELALSLKYLATASRQLDDPEPALAALARARAIQEKSLGPDAPAVALTIRSIAGVLEDTGRYGEARTTYEQAIGVQERALGPDALDLAQTLNNYATLLRTLGEYDLALSTRKRCLAIREKALGHDHPQVAWALHNMANLYDDMGDPEQAKALYEEALAIRLKTLPPTHADLGYSYNSLGVLLNELGELPAARAMFEKSLAIREKNLGPEHRLVAACLHNLGNVCRYLGDFGESKRLLERSVRIKEATQGADNVDTAITASDLASAIQDSGDLAAARALHERALATLKDKLGPRHHDVGWCMNNLGNLVRLQGDRASAKALLEGAVAILRETLGSEHPDTIWALRDLADLDLEIDDRSAARALIDEAAATWRRVAGPGHPRLAALLETRARVLWTAGEPKAALDDALEADRIARAQFLRNVRGLTQREALGYSALRRGGLDIAWSIVVSGGARARPASWREQVVDAMVRSRALVLAEAARRRRVASGARSAEAARAADDLERASTRLSHLLYASASNGGGPRYLDQLRSTVTARDRAELALAQTSATFRQGLAEEKVGLSDVTAVLPSGSALVSYVAFDHVGATHREAPRREYLAVVITRASPAPRIVPLGPAEAIDDAVAAWKREAARPPSGAGDGSLDAYGAAGARLRSLVWDPVRPLLGSAGRAFIVPDGALSIVSFASLPGAAGRFLVEDEPVFHYLDAERELAAPAPAAGGPRRSDALVVGGADYDLGVKAPAAAPAPGAPSDCGRLASMSFPPLAAAGLEADEVASAWTGGSVVKLTGVEATEAAFRRLAPGRALLHLATHAFLMEDGACAAPGFEGNPLLLSGIALAGANARGAPAASGAAEGGLDDGILSADEIAGLDLSAAHCVVLSGCETAAGKVQLGEGIIGLRRAFATAGARALVMSVWQVKDAATRAWMDRFYEQLEAGGSIDEAVRGASLAILAGRRAAGQSTHPFYWGCFLSSGGWTAPGSRAASNGTSSSVPPDPDRSTSAWAPEASAAAGTTTAIASAGEARARRISPAVASPDHDTSPFAPRTSNRSR
jgi:CHAT domain-containing protein/tetratricopeptide (TPR) repeat protein